MLSAAEAGRPALPARSTAKAHLSVVSSPTLHAGRRITITEATTVGRSPDCALHLDHDDYVSSRHALLTPADPVCGSRISARRTARSSTALRSRPHACSRRATRFRSARRSFGWSREDRARCSRSRTPGGAGSETRTPTSATRRCSPIADGMGGAQAGELASQLAAAATRRAQRGVKGEAAVTELVQAANARVYQRALEDPAAAGMGTTVTVAVFDAESEHDRHRSRRRLEGVPDPRGAPRAAHRRPLPRRRAGPQRQAHPRAGGGPPAPVGDHTRPRHRGRASTWTCSRWKPRPGDSICSVPTG